MKKAAAVLLLLAVMLSLCACGEASPASVTAEYLMKNAESVPGSEWAALPLAAGGYEKADAWLHAYREALAAEVGANAGLSGTQKAANYARTVIALTAMGENAADFAGADLTAPLRDTELVTSQGIAAVSFALLALDSGGYPSEERECYVNYLLDARLPDGGFANSGERSDPDSTSMALQALAPYRGESAVDEAIESGIACLSAMQRENGGYSSWGIENCESTAQVILALAALGIAADDARFVKNGAALTDALMTYAQKDGSFAHTPDGAPNLMATMQALQALTALEHGNIFCADFCTVELRCDPLLENMELLRENKRSLVPADGVILSALRVPLSEGESAMDVTRRALEKQGIQYEFSITPGTGSAYVEGIANLYEFDAGSLSGWEYSVNGAFCGLSASDTAVQPGDRVCWLFTCDLGADIGNGAS